ncbi:MAG: acyl carrier protein [Candidatus Brocadia sp.]|nr:acyl carrier protein [Candidatus Brocadia sp.]
MEEKFGEAEQKVKEIIKRVLKVKDTEIKKESSIAELGGDSLSALSILSAIEEEFNINIPDEETAEIDSFSGAVQLVKKHIKGNK